MAFTLTRGWIRKLTCIGCVSTLIGCGSKPAPIPPPPKAVVATPSIVAIVSEPTTDNAKKQFEVIRGRYDASKAYGGSLDPNAMAWSLYGVVSDLTEIPAPFAGESDSWVKLT